MLFPLTRFLGLTVRDFRGGLGWGGQQGQLTVNLVADDLTGDYPQVPPAGSPVYFQCEQYYFGGLLQRWAERSDASGNPVYEAILVDPREILAGVPIIISSYAGTIGLSNVCNVYGYWENRGFGSSAVNSAGMPAGLVIEAVLAILNGESVYGGPLEYKGYRYTLDLSELPTPPAYYRIPGPHLNLLEMLQMWLDDAACDFFFELVGFVIRLRVVSRFFQPPLGTIRQLVASSAYSGYCTQVESGFEDRNEVTSAFLVGGEKTSLHFTQECRGFWGYDLNGLPILGESAAHPDAGMAEFMNLNAAGVADILGSTSYACNTVEIRCAMHSYATWSAYIKKYKPHLLPIIHCLFNKGIELPACKPDLIDDRAIAVIGALNSKSQNDAQRLYEFVKSYGTDYYGKQYLVPLPFVLAKTEPESQSLRLVTSWEPTDAGYYPGGLSGLGVSLQNQELLLAPDERILPFAYFPTITGMDTSRINWSETVLQGTSLLLRTQVNPRIVFLGGNLLFPHVLVKLSAAVYEAPLDPFGFSPILNPIVFGGNADKLKKNEAGGTFGELRCWPAAIHPSSFAIPLKSNLETYGPWYVAGPPGKVRFDQDPSLTPWDYGSETAMNYAALARVTTAVTNMQSSESGSFTATGMPAFSLGDVLQAGGPNLTNIEVTVGSQGVMTSYRFQTFTPRFGLFSRQNAERLKRISLGQVELRKRLRKALTKQLAALATINSAFRGWLANAPKYIRKESPYDIVMAKSFADGGNTRVLSSSTTYDEALTTVGIKEDDFKSAAMCSLGGLFRPFTTQTSGEKGLLPGYKDLTAASYITANNANAITMNSLNPYAAGHDIEVVLSGDTYEHSHAYRHGSDPQKTRSLALRGPLLLAGWGPGLFGGYYPGNGAGGYAANTLRGSQNWPVGAVDLLWDDYRGLWTSHDVITAVLPSGTTLSANGSATGWVGGHSGWPVTIHNIFSTPVVGGSGGTRVIAAYALNANKFVVIAADCL